MPNTPDGIAYSAQEAGLWDRHASPISILILGAFLLAGLTGILGGAPSPHRLLNFEGAQMEVKGPAVLRNGEYFEINIRIVAQRPIGDATLAVSSSLWRDMTINSALPAAGEEGFRDGSFRMSYGPMEAGEVLEVKFDGQINPPLFAGTHGHISLYDGNRLLGRTAVTMAVRP